MGKRPSPRPSKLPATSTPLSGVHAQRVRYQGSNTRHRSCCFVIVFAAPLTLAAATGARAQTDPVALVQQLLAAFDRSDAAGMLALFAEDAVIDDEGGPCAAAPCIGKDAIQKALERRAANPPPVHTILKTYVSGNVATIRVEVQSDWVKKAGGERIIEWAIFETKGAKISYTHGGILDRADPQTARFAEWRRTQQAQPPAQ
jgi:ketosteroid isomerase-like protein